MDVFHYNLNLMNLTRDFHSFSTFSVHKSERSFLHFNKFVQQTNWTIHLTYRVSWWPANWDLWHITSLAGISFFCDVHITHMLLATDISCICDWSNKLCAWQHNIPPPPASLTIISCKYENHQRVQLPMNSLKDKQRLKKISTVPFTKFVSTLSKQSKAQQNMGAGYAFFADQKSWPLNFWPWKWCLSHVWRALPLCQF